jgi:hypothetical protein
MLVMVPPVHAGNQVTTSFHGITFVTPPGWTVESIDEDQIMVRTDLPDRPEISIRRFILAKNKQIRSRDEMIAAVKGLFSELGITSETDIALEYNNSKTVMFNTACHVRTVADDKSYFFMIKGLFCNDHRHGQTLYLLEYKDAAAPDAPLAANLERLFESALLTETALDDIYPSDAGLNYLYVIILIGLAAFFFARNRRIQNSRNPLGRSSEHFWRCPNCRMINHNDKAQCRRCGSLRPEPQNIRQ